MIGDRGPYPCLIEPAEVAIFLFSPDFDHFTGVGFTVSVLPAVFSGDVSLTVLEDQN